MTTDTRRWEFTHRTGHSSRCAARAALALLLLAGCAAGAPPVATNQAVVLDEDAVFSGRLGMPRADRLAPLGAGTYSIVTQPAHGTVTLGTDSGAFSYYPSKDYNGPDSFTFAANYGWGWSSATVSITVNPVNDAPTLPDIPDQIVRSGDPGSTVAVGAADVDGDALSYRAFVSDPGVARAEVDASGTLALTGVNQGMNSVRTTLVVEVSDGGLLTSRTFGLTVLPPPPAPPANLAAEPGDGEVDLTWAPSPGALWYLVHWSADPLAPIDQFQTIGGVAQPSWKHSGLANLTTYRYAVSAIGDGGQGLPSSEVDAEPGPVPGPVAWAVAVSAAATDTLHWATAPDATSYRVYFSDQRDALQGRRPDADFVEAAASPAEVVPLGKPLGWPTYYRVTGINGSRIGTGGPVASSTVLSSLAVTAPCVTPALADVDGDGCLDMVGARGDCQGGFRAEPLDQLGLAGLFAAGRVNRDSRFADYTGDGQVDIFTNVYSRADDPGSRAILHINDGTGHFTEDPGIAEMQIGGYGETVLAADYNNDGFVDLFVPHYWHLDDGGRNWLLMNDGSGRFVDRAFQAGVAYAGPPAFPYVPEGAQALDFDLDGWVDIFVASHLLINNRDGTFRDVAGDLQLPTQFDEGAAFVDIDQDGDLDYVVDTSFSTLLFRNVNGRFAPAETLEEDATRFGYGLAVCDVNGDDLPDLVVPRNDPSSYAGEPVILLNVGGHFVRTDTGLPPGGYIDLVSCADLDGNGSLDIVTRWQGYRVLRNAASSPTSLSIRLLGAAGERNQQGRVVHIKPLAADGKLFARVVESGSGYLAQGGYDLKVGAAYPGEYEIAVFQDGRIVRTTTTQGQDITIFADGRVSSGLR